MPTIHPVPTVNGSFRGRDILDPVRLTITFAFLMGAALALAQAPSKDPGSLKFEVASIKPSAPGGRGGGARPDPGGKRYRGTNVPLRLYMVACYRLRADQILYAPAWVDSEPFDILAEAPKQSSVEEMYLMMRNLIIERCHLKFHLENRETNIYALTVDAAGAKLQRHDAANGGEPWIEQATVAPFHSKWTATAANMDIFTGRLSRMMDRPVIDMTGLAGGYDFTLTYTADPPSNLPPDAKIKNGEPIDLSGPTIFQAVRQQLGLRLEARKGPVPVMVIEHIERPSRN